MGSQTLLLEIRKHFSSYLYQTVLQTLHLLKAREGKLFVRLLESGNEEFVISDLASRNPETLFFLSLPDSSNINFPKKCLLEICSCKIKRQTVNKRPKLKDKCLRKRKVNYNFSR